jgi:hypothetical protein
MHSELSTIHFEPSAIQSADPAFPQHDTGIHFWWSRRQSATDCIVLAADEIMPIADGITPVADGIALAADRMKSRSTDMRFAPADILLANDGIEMPRA